jgi:pimeloyl-ACP methyl ester carboxylesterase
LCARYQRSNSASPSCRTADTIKTFTNHFQPNAQGHFFLATVQNTGVPTTSVNGINLYYETTGTGPPLVMIGGLGLAVPEMARLSGPLAGKFQVTAVDNRGTGRSSAPQGPYSIEQMAGDIAALIGQLGLGRVNVLGISMGGRIALSLALSRPDLVDRLILVVTSPRAGTSRWRVRLGMAFSILTRPFDRNPQQRHARKAQFDATSNFDCTDRLGEITAPALIINAKSDRIAPPSFGEEMRDKIPDSRLVLVNGGHIAPLITQRDRVMSEVTEFLSANP